MDSYQFEKPVVGLCAYSGSGKTTLLERLIPVFNSHELNVAVIKHAHHSFDIDHPEKDSYKIRKAGAQQVLVSSQKRWALIHEVFSWMSAQRFCEETSTCWAPAFLIL